MDETEQLRFVLETLHGGLDTQPYHFFLGVEEQCAGDELRVAFHARAEMFHPDRFQDAGDAELRSMVYAVYKRITEAYRVLGDPEQRREYEEQRKTGNVRLERTARPSGPLKRADDALTPAAKKYYTMAVDAERRGDAKGAKFNLQMAIQMQPDSELLKGMMEKYK